MTNPYIYEVEEIVSVYDGDTIKCKVDLGFNVTKVEKFRLDYVNAPELRGNSLHIGRQSRDWLRQRLQEAFSNKQKVLLKSTKGLIGRSKGYFAEFFIDGKSINDEMISLGHAKNIRIQPQESKAIVNLRPLKYISEKK